MRISLAILGPVFLLSGLLGVMEIDFGQTTRVNGRVVVGDEARDVSLRFLLIGLVLCVVRFYFMRPRVDAKDART
jgi:hypothetical protein